MEAVGDGGAARRRAGARAVRWISDGDALACRATAETGRGASSQREGRPRSGAGADGGDLPGVGAVGAEELDLARDDDEARAAACPPGRRGRRRRRSGGPGRRPGRRRSSASGTPSKRGSARSSAGESDDGRWRRLGARHVGGAELVGPEGAGAGAGEGVERAAEIERRRGSASSGARLMARATSGVEARGGARGGAADGGGAPPLVMATISASMEAKSWKGSLPVAHS